MVPRSAAVRVSPFNRVLACVVIAAHLGTPALSVAASAPAAPTPTPALAKKIATAKRSMAPADPRPGVQVTPHPTEWTEKAAPTPAVVSPVAPGPPVAGVSRTNNPFGVKYGVITHRAISDVVIHRPDCDAGGNPLFLGPCGHIQDHQHQ